jgi:hypothetical protein
MYLEGRHEQSTGHQSFADVNARTDAERREEKFTQMSIVSAVNL